jgi:multicomponent Na+:H+ antiporter subunit A
VAGPERGFRLGLRALDRLSDRVYLVEARDLRSRVGSVLPSAAVLVALGLVFTPREEIALVVGPLGRGDVLVALTMALAALAALTATWRQDHLTLALVLSGVGFSLAVTYALLGAPDVALVAVLVETIFSLLFLGMLATLPRDVDPARVQASREDAPTPPAPHRSRNLVLAGAGGALAFVVAWVSLSHPDPATTIASEHIALAPQAHGKDVVTVILADFRGFDTLGEITVIAIAGIGLLALLRGRRAS